jgi:hypothetical protein
MNSAKVAIITGSATGLGAAAAIRLAKAGCRIVINYSKSRDEAEATAQSCRDTGADAIVFQADVGDDSACRAMAQAAIDRWARIDYLVNNAARTKFIPYRNLEDLAGDDFLPRQRRRRLSDEPGGRAPYETTGSGRHREHVLDRRGDRDRLVHGVRGKQGRAQRDDKVARARSGAGDQGERDRAGSDSNTLAQRGIGRRSL